MPVLPAGSVAVMVARAPEAVSLAVTSKAPDDSTVALSSGSPKKPLPSASKSRVPEVEVRVTSVSLSVLTTLPKASQAVTVTVNGTPAACV